MPPTIKTKEVVILIHGIRTNAIWQRKVKTILEEIPGIFVQETKYGFFHLFLFWFPFTRWPAIREVKGTIQEVKNQFPACKVSVIAHSNGTYIISKLLQSEKDLSLNRLVICGSIVKRRYPWDRVKGRIKHKVVNDYGTRDIWPVFATAFSWGYGDTGRHPFGKAFVNDRGHDFAHSDYFKEENGEGEEFIRKFWKPFFESGEFVTTSHVKDSPWWLNVLSVLPIQWLLTIGTCVWAFWFFGNSTEKEAVRPARYRDLYREIGQLVADDLKQDGKVGVQSHNMIGDTLRFAVVPDNDGTGSSVHKTLIYTYDDKTEIKVQVSISGTFPEIALANERKEMIATIENVSGANIRANIRFVNARPIK